MRKAIIEQSKIFFEENAQAVNTSESPNENQPSIGIKQFKQWIDTYPFIRSIVRESMMPRVWTLQPKIHAVKPLAHEFTINKNPANSDEKVDDMLSDVSTGDARST